MKILVLSLVLLLSSCMSVITTIPSIVSASNDRRSLGSITDDKIIFFTLEKWASEEKVLKVAHLNFTLYNGDVLITGEVPSLKIKQYLSKQIKIQEPKINKIFNETVIAKNSHYTNRLKDSIIDGKIDLFLNNQEVVNPIHIIVHTENKVVFLMGDVTKREGKKAATVAASVDGVLRVVKLFNYLEHQPQKEIDAYKKKELEEENMQSKRIKQRKLLLQQQQLRKKINLLEREKQSI